MYKKLCQLEVWNINIVLFRPGQVLPVVRVTNSKLIEMVTLKMIFTILVNIIENKFKSYGNVNKNIFLFITDILSAGSNITG